MLLLTVFITDIASHHSIIAPIFGDSAFRRQAAGHQCSERAAASHGKTPLWQLAASSDSICDHIC